MRWIYGQLVAWCLHYWPASHRSKPKHWKILTRKFANVNIVCHKRCADCRPNWFAGCYSRIRPNGQPFMNAPNIHSLRIITFHHLCRCLVWRANRVLISWKAPKKSSKIWPSIDDHLPSLTTNMVRFLYDRISLPICVGFYFPIRLGPFRIFFLIEIFFDHFYRRSTRNGNSISSQKSTWSNHVSMSDGQK